MKLVSTNIKEIDTDRPSHIVGNYIIRKSRETQRWLKKNPQFSVVYQPVYLPWVNHVERF